MLTADHLNINLEDAMKLEDYLKKEDINMSDFARQIGACLQTISNIVSHSGKGISLLLAHAIVAGSQGNVTLEDLPISEKCKLMLQKYEIEKKISQLSRSEKAARKLRREGISV